MFPFSEIVAAMLLLAMGAWLIGGAKRIIRTPMYVARPTVFNWLVRKGAEAEPLFFGGKLSVQFLAWLYLLLGIVLVLLAGFLVVAVVWRLVS